jgi:hypothetical protein
MTTMTSNRSMLLRPPLVVLPDGVMVIAADALSDTPFSVAVTVRFSTPTEFPAVKVVVELVAGVKLPSLLLRDQE